MRARRMANEGAAVNSYRTGTELVLTGRNDLGMCFAVLIESVASKPAHFKNRSDALPGNSTAFVWVAWKGVPPAA